MNCTARMSASANHFLLSEPTMENPRSSLCGVSSVLMRRRDATRHHLRFASYDFQFVSKSATLRPHGEELRRSTARSHTPSISWASAGRCSSCASSCTRTPASLLGPARPARRLRHEHPRRTSEGARAPAASSGGERSTHRQHRGSTSSRSTARASSAVLHVLAHWGARSLRPPSASGDLEPGWLRAPCASRCPPPSRARSSFESATSSRRSPTGTSSRGRSTLRTPSWSGIRRASTASWSSATSTPWR